MTNHRRKAKDSSEIASLLRARGRMIISAPHRSGKTTELLRYAEERYPNGRFAIVCAREEDKYTIPALHWRIYNGISQADVVAKRLMGEKLDGDDVNVPTVLVSPNLYLPSQFTPLFADDFYSLPKSAQRFILKYQLFIAAVGSTEEEDDGEEG